jgi:hypothetical protein
VSSEFYRASSRDNGSLFSFCAWIERVPPLAATNELSADERQRVLERIAEAQRWLSSLENALEQREAEVA